MRYFNNQMVELLAPCGNFDIFLDLLETKADAFYLGGKQFNMRMHRKDFNFTQDEIRTAVKKAHELEKKIYVTINNLMDTEELESLDAYLLSLDEMGVDAIIVQDIAVIERVRDLDLSLECHASVMMNAHNLKMIEYLKTLGVTRAVISRDISLAEVKWFKSQTSVEMEYFIHGDMCAVHGSQCHYSGMLFGKSSNRGLCMKPCRWQYHIEVGNQIVETTFPMAVKDMYMYENIPELIDSGVVSFKIEGRMRDSEYLKMLIDAYGDAIDRYIEDPIHYERKVATPLLYDNRKRDFSTARAFENAGLSYINERYEGTGKFYSTGKPFSNPVSEFDLIESDVSTFSVNSSVNIGMPKLSVRVNDLAQALTAIESGADRIYLSMEPYLGLTPPTREGIKALVAHKRNCEVYLALPRMCSDKVIDQFVHYLQRDDMGIDGLLIGHYGWIDALKNVRLNKVGDYTLNVFNPIAYAHYTKAGLTGVTASIELKQNEFSKWLEMTYENKEVVVQGHPTVMYMDQDMFENLPDSLKNNTHHLMLVDASGGKHPVFKDFYGKNHYHLSKPLSLLPIIHEVIPNVSWIRIEGCIDSLDTLRQMVKSYKGILSGALSIDQVKESLGNNATLGALHYQ